MQQFCEFCEYLNLFNASPKKIYEILVQLLENNLSLSDQNYLFDCLNERSLSLETPLFDTNGYDSNIFTVQTNQLIVALLHRLCKMKQNQHLILNLKRKTSVRNLEDDSDSFSTKKFCLMKNIGKSKSAMFIEKCAEQTSTQKRRNTIETDQLNKPSAKLTFMDLFQAKNPFQLVKLKGPNIKIKVANCVVPSTIEKKEPIRCSIFHKIVSSSLLNNYITII